MLYKNILLSFILLIFTGCASVSNYTPMRIIPRDGVITVLPFQNNTNTPLAGQRAKNIALNILRAKNYYVDSLSLKDDYITRDDIKKIANKIKTKYYLFGSVNEWRYKTGIEAQPTVAISFSVIKKDTNRVIYSAVGAKNGGGDDSTSLLAQKLFWELIR